MHVEFARPVQYFAKIKPHQSMRIVHQLYLPGVNVGNVYADFFLQLAAQGLLDRFTWLQLAAWNSQ